MQYITQLDEFLQVLETIKTETAVAIDTEFEWTKTYHPIAALLQIGTAEQCWLIDLIEIEGYEEALCEFLENEQIIKILHSCSQDLILFHNICGAVTRNIFDSQIACAFLGFQVQAGYAKVIKHFLDIELDKSAQRSDWSKRPLSDKQLTYASYDVIYLMQIYPNLVEQVEAKGFTDALKEECTKYENDEYYAETPDDELYRSVKGAGKLKRPQLAIIRELAIWRDLTGQRIDRRPNRVMKDGVLLHLAINKITEPTQLHSIKDLHPSAIRRDGSKICRIISKALEIKIDDCPPAFKSRFPSDAEKAVEERISQQVQKVAEKREGESQLLITRGT